MSHPNTDRTRDTARRKAAEERRLEMEAAHLGVPKFLLRLAGLRRFKPGAAEPVPRNRHD